MATKTDTAPATAPVARGFGNLLCPKCNAVALVQVRLDDLTTFACCECEDEFDLDDVRELLAQAKRWQPVLAWLETAPAVEGED